VTRETGQFGSRLPSQSMLGMPVAAVPTVSRLFAF